jgi:hypothetical protein
MGTVGTVFETKENSMNWIKLKLRDWINSAQDVRETVYATRSKNQLVPSSLSDIDSEDGLSITVRSAIGGRIVTFRHYDRRTDRHNHKLYIVPEDQDFERELGKMITMESMRG